MEKPRGFIHTNCLSIFTNIRTVYLLPISNNRAHQMSQTAMYTFYAIQITYDEWLCMYIGGYRSVSTCSPAVWWYWMNRTDGERAQKKYRWIIIVRVESGWGKNPFCGVEWRHLAGKVFHLAIAVDYLRWNKKRCSPRTIHAASNWPTPHLRMFVYQHSSLSTRLSLHTARLRASWTYSI